MNEEIKANAAIENKTGEPSAGSVTEAQAGQLIALAVMESRSRMAAALGKSFEGKRDLYSVLGYLKTPDPDDLEAYGARESLGGRVVRLPVAASWKKAPDVKDRPDEDTEPAGESAFVQDLRTLAEKRKVRLWASMKHLDLVSRWYQFGIMVLGVRDDQKLEDPIEGTLAGGTEALARVYVFGQNRVIDIDYFTDELDPETFGEPEFYTVDFGALAGHKAKIGHRRVHHSRVIHVANESAPPGAIFGRSCLEPPLNRLQDLAKVVGGTSEAAWLLAWKGAVIKAMEGAAIDVEDMASLRDKSDELLHGFRRTLALSNADYDVLGGEAADSSPQVEALAKLIGADADIPYRLLLGTEEGQLAGSTDMENWAGAIRSRQENHCEPNVVRVVIGRLIDLKIIKPPAGGNYDMEWAPVYEPKPIDKADEWLKRGQALLAAVQAVLQGAELTADEVRAFALLDPLPEDAETTRPPAPAASPNGEGPPPAANRRAALRPLAQAIRHAILAANVEPIRPVGGADTLSAIPADNTPTTDQILEALAEWDEAHPRFRGLLDALPPEDVGEVEKAQAREDNGRPV